MPIKVFGGSIPGVEHLGTNGLPKNESNQDSFVIESVDEDSAVMIVCDGCGGEPHSKIGSHIVSKLLAPMIVNEYKSLQGRIVSWETLLKNVQQNLLEKVLSVARILCVDDDSKLRTVIKENLLCTVLGAIVTKEEVIIFYCGDGVLVYNGEVEVLKSNDNNEPAYFVYLSTSSQFSREDLQFRIWKQDKRGNFNSLALGTDGCVDIIGHESVKLSHGFVVPPFSAFWSDDSYVKNPCILQRKLNLMNMSNAVNGQIRSGILPDDTTLVVCVNDCLCDLTNSQEKGG